MAAFPLSGATLTVTFRSDAVVVDGLTPGGGVALFGITREPKGFYSRMSRVIELVPDDDRDGRAEYKLKAPFVSRSIWCAVDVRSGAHTIVTGGGYPNDRQAKDGVSRGRRGTDGETSRIEHERQSVELLLVRPGGEVWWLPATAGGWADDGTAAGTPTFSTSIEKFIPVTKHSQPIRSISRGDVVLAIDPMTMEYFVVESN